MRRACAAQELLVMPLSRLRPLMQKTSRKTTLALGLFAFALLLTILG